MKLGPVTRPDKRNTATLKQIKDDIMSANCNVNVFPQFLANLQPSGSRTPDILSIKLAFLKTITFYLTKPEHKTKKSLTQHSYYCFE